jgi:hypothetical protein
MDAFEPANKRCRMFFRLRLGFLYGLVEGFSYGQGYYDDIYRLDVLDYFGHRVGRHALVFSEVGYFVTCEKDDAEQPKLGGLKIEHLLDPMRHRRLPTGHPASLIDDDGAGLPGDDFNAVGNVINGDPDPDEDRTETGMDTPTGPPFFRLLSSPAWNLFRPSQKLTYRSETYGHYVANWYLARRIPTADNCITP